VGKMRRKEIGRIYGFIGKIIDGDNMEENYLGFEG
jgi:hypothetical protein